MYRIPVSSYIIIKASSTEDAKVEYESIKESLVHNFRIPSEEEKELFINSEVDGRVEEDVDDFSEAE